MTRMGIIGLILQYKYVVLIALGIPEGPILSIIAGFLWRAGYLSFLPMYLALMSADLLGDVIWYGVGRYWGSRFIARFGHLFSITRQKMETVERLFHRHKDWLLLISKMTGGLGFAVVTLMTAGLVKIPFRRYMLLNILGQFAWSGVLIGMGYSFGHLYAAIDTVIWRAFVGAVSIIILLLLVGYGKYLRSRFISARA